MGKAITNEPVLGQGVYTIPDAAHILELAPPSLRRWVNGYWIDSEAGRTRSLPVDNVRVWGEHRDRAFNFYTLIELYTVMACRKLGVSFPKIRQARQELAERFGSEYPFANQKLMCDGKRILVEFKDTTVDTLLTLGTRGEQSFQKILEPFCLKLDFDPSSELVNRLWPLGKDAAVVVDPRLGFGRPTISGTGIATETIFNLVRAHEETQTICELYDLTEEQVNDVVRFETRKTA